MRARLTPSSPVPGHGGLAAGNSPPPAVPDDSPDGTGPRSAHRPAGLLWHRDFRLLWIGESVSGMGTAMAAVGMPLLATAVLHASTFAVATLTAASYLPWLVMGLPAGVWVDRLPSRTLMISCDAVSALLYASLPAAGWLHVLGIRQLIAVALLAGCANVFFATAYRVYLSSLVTPDDLVEANAKLQGSTSVANICGRGAAGITAQAVGYASALLVNAVSFLVSLGCLLSIRAAEPRRHPAARGTTIRAEIASGISFIAHDPYLRPLTLYGAIANLAYSGSTALVVVFLVRVVGLSPATTGLVLAVSGIGGVLGALIARRLVQRLGTARAVLAASIGTSMFALLIPLTAAGARVAYFAIGSTVVATGIVTVGIIIGSFQQAYCPPGMLGCVSASMRFLVFGGIPLGALLAGGLATALGTRNALWTILALYVLSGLLLLTPAIWSQRNLGCHASTHLDHLPGTTVQMVRTEASTDLWASSHQADQLVTRNAAPLEEFLGLLKIHRIGQNLRRLVGYLREPPAPKRLDQDLLADLHDYHRALPLRDVVVASVLVGSNPRCIAPGGLPPRHGGKMTLGRHGGRPRAPPGVARRPRAGDRHRHSGPE